MKSAIVRLIVISSTTLFLLFGAIVWLRFLGQMQDFSALDHPLLLSTSTWQILKYPEPHPHQEGFQNWRSSQLQSDTVTPWLDLRRTQDGHWILAPTEWVQLPQGKIAVHLLTLEEVKTYWPAGQPLTFAEVLSDLGERPLWLNIIEKDIHWIKDWEKLIPSTLTRKIVISSPSKQFGKKLREAQPDWLYAGESTSLRQFVALEGIFLESVGNYWADIFYASKEELKQRPFSARLIKELNRRQLPIVVELSEDKALNETLLTTPDLKLKGLVSSTQEISEKNHN